MRKLLVVVLVLGAIAAPEAATAQPPDTVPLFAGAGTPVTNGVFFPGTATYDGKNFLGVPLRIQQGQDIQFINTDPAAATNAHAIVSFKRNKKGRALFASSNLRGPASEIVKTSHLRPGVYAYYCSVHFGMYGLIEVSG